MRIKKIERLIVKYHEQIVGTLSLTPDNKQCAFEYDKAWLSNGFSISPLELPLKPGLFIAKPSPFYGNFGVFEDSLPDGSTHRIADELNVTVQTVRNYFGGVNYQFGKNAGMHIEPGPDGGIVVLDDTTIYDMAVKILEEQNQKQ